MSNIDKIKFKTGIGFNQSMVLIKKKYLSIPGISISLDLNLYKTIIAANAELLECYILFSIN